MTENLALIQALNMKMSWHGQRQQALAENIANADTPGYKPKDLIPLDFKGLLESSTSLNSVSAVALSATDSKHISSGSTSGFVSKTVKKDQNNPYEASPSGNAVDLEEQLLKMNQNFTDHSFVSNLYQKNVEMMKQSLK